MPQRHSGIKELKKSQKRRLHNIEIKTDLKKTIKAYVAATGTDAEKAKELLPGVHKKLDKAAKRNVLHKNTAARRKSRYTKLLKEKQA